jgi:putative DNA primase/helicase
MDNADEAAEQRNCDARNTTKNGAREGRQHARNGSADLRAEGERLTAARKEARAVKERAEYAWQSARDYPGPYTEAERATFHAAYEDAYAAWTTASKEEGAFFDAHPEEQVHAGHESMARNGVDEPDDHDDDTSEEAPKEDTPPVIQITADLTKMVDKAEAALLKLSDGPIIFQRARQLVRIAPASQSPTWLQRPPDSPIIAPMSLAALRELSSQSIKWQRYDKRANKWNDTLPSSVALETLAARVSWQFPYLEGIICAPTLRPDGVLLQTPGYDTATGLFLDFNGMQFPPIPEAPTRADAIRALTQLAEPFAEFPFAAECHKSAALAATLTQVARPAIRGSVPLYGVSAHSRGTGKGLLIDTIATIGTGRRAPVWTHTTNEDEQSKQLLSLAMAGDSVAHIDNVTEPFGSGALDSAITSSARRGRLLGTNTLIEAPWNAVLFCSGNNMTFRADTVRRVIPIDLDAKSEHPELRSDFTHSPLLDWVTAERPRLVVAALTVLRAFFHAGCPKEPEVPEYGSFETWSNLIRHSLIWCELPDPCDGRKNLESESDPQYEALANLLECWKECYPKGEAQTLKRIIQDIEHYRTPEPSTANPPNDWDALRDALGAYDAKYDGKRLDAKRIGNALRTIEGRVLDGVRLVRSGKDHNAALWKREILR